MSFLSFLLGQKKTSASVAKERLQIILAHERGRGDSPDYLPQLQQELIAVISKYVKINPCLLYTSACRRRSAGRRFAG